MIDLFLPDFGVNLLTKLFFTFGFWFVKILRCWVGLRSLSIIIVRGAVEGGLWFFWGASCGRVRWGALRDFIGLGFGLGHFGVLRSAALLRGKLNSVSNSSKDGFLLSRDVFCM